ncbi:MAG: beta-ketoacyl-[acyl-carrier-protein] synthase family protein [Candidatus Omnitrophica bacterium]|nr:beta-ketoacyl-[acyl-carrier-protein] synthase family protein [Candidatus Omnitrophota bacterium]MBU1869438.1 beta-ketoacyl-[acyl-carrier-protein] synthase family protein [Candidatus Omnitrophota bacterium]
MGSGKRIVITGLGVVSSIGIGKQAFWEALTKGVSGISEISSFDTSAFPTHLGGEVKHFKTAGPGRASQLAIAASKLALEDSGLAINDSDKNAFGICLGTTMGESQVLEVINDTWVHKGIDAIDVSLIPKYPTNVLSLNVADHFKLKGPNFVIPTACAAGNYAIGYAYDLIRAGEAEFMLAGGADAFSRIAFIGFNRLLAVAPKVCQPFDKNRKGMMVGEGAGVVVVEPLESALKRKANIYAEILGYGLSCDAHHMTAPFSEGIKDALEKAVNDSGIKKSDVSYISAHGTGTPSNDREECLGIKKAFPDNYRNIPVSSIKSMLGHTMGAASAIEAITCCMALKTDMIPPTINYETPDPDCDIDCVPNVARKAGVNIALNNASAFGGNNACLALRKF